jgi:hypothetical protein
MFAALVLVSFTGVLIYLAFNLVSKAVLGSWHESEVKNIADPPGKTRGGGWPSLPSLDGSTNAALLKPAPAQQTTRCGYQLNTGRHREQGNARACG